MQKTHDIEIPEDDIFKNDLLDRKSEIENLTQIVLNFNDPIVLALDSPWGTGKTTFVNLWQAHLKKEGKQSIYFNAWETDFAEDPLIVLVSELNKWLKSRNQSVASTFLDKSKKVLPSIAKQTAIGAIKALTLIGIDSQEVERVISEAMGNITGDLIDNFNKQSESIQQFKEIISEALESLPDEQKNLVIFIDELDRCRPTYAIELLERIKHLFNIKRLVFVLSTDTVQLTHSICAVYGNNFDAKKYLQRFIDLDYSLKEPTLEKYIESQLQALKIIDYFIGRDNRGYERNNLVEYYVFLAKRFSLKLRDINLSLTRLSLVLYSVPKDHYLDEILLLILLFIREHNKELYDKYVVSPVAANDIIKFIAESMSIKEKQENYFFIMIAYLIAPVKYYMAHNNGVFKDFIADYKKLEITDEEGTERILGMIDSFEKGFRGGISHKPTIERIELLHRINV